jgi:hypothetical protein
VGAAFASVVLDVLLWLTSVMVSPDGVFFQRYTFMIVVPLTMSVALEVNVIDEASELAKTAVVSVPLEAPPPLEWVTSVLLPPP